VALATKCTGDESVLPPLGEETDTPANAQTDSVSKQNSVFIGTPALSNAQVLRNAGLSAVEALVATRLPEQNCFRLY
jgi:hypothetical protein